LMSSLFSWFSINIFLSFLAASSSAAAMSYRYINLEVLMTWVLSSGLLQCVSLLSFFSSTFLFGKESKVREKWVFSRALTRALTSWTEELTKKSFTMIDMTGSLGYSDYAILCSICSLDSRSNFGRVYGWHKILLVSSVGQTLGNQCKKTLNDSTTDILLTQNFFTRNLNANQA
jgi:hypothetical protein